MEKIHLGVSSDAGILFFPYIAQEVIRSYKILPLFKMNVCFHVEECESRTKPCRRVMYSSLKIYFTKDYSLCGREIAACLLIALYLFCISTI